MKKLPFLIIFVFYLFQTAKAETEPNDNSSQANLLILNNTQDGTLTGTDVDDWFVLAVPQGGILNITVHKTGGGNARVYLLDADKVGFPEITNLYLGYSDSPPEGWILSYPVLPGNYYVHFFRYDPSVSYSVTPAVAPSSFGQDIEPNHVSTDAQVISSTGSVGGTLRYYRPNEGTDMADWFKMLVPQGGILNLKIHKTGPGNTWFRLRDAETPNFPEISNFYAGYGQSPTEGWNWGFPVLAGDYYFQVEEGEYWLDYKIEAALAAPIWGEDIEPNDSLNLAQNAPVNGTIPGLMGYYQPGFGYDNWDWFVLNTPENGLLSFQISKTGYQNGNVRIRNETAEIGTSYLGFSDQNTSFSQLVPAGKYYLGVEKYGGDFQYKVVSTLLPSPVANFTFAQTGNVFAFENTTLHQASFVWKFDDGTTATTVNAYHEYKEPGNYEVCLIATNVAGADTICQAVIMPGVARALPAEGGNTGDVTLQVFGGGLDTNYVAKIMDGTTVIAASTFTDFGGKSSINVQFDLRNKPVGAYELRIEKPGGPSYTVPGGFKIVEGVAANPWVRISGRNRILFNTWTTYTLDYGNFGNVDASFVPIWLSLFKESRAGC